MLGRRTVQKERRTNLEPTIFGKKGFLKTTEVLPSYVANSAISNQCDNFIIQPINQNAVKRPKHIRSCLI